MPGLQAKGAGVAGVIAPVTFRRACAFVAENHRHNKPPRGHKFSISVRDELWRIVGVAMVGRPVARALDDGVTCGVNRTCTDGSKNVQQHALRGVLASGQGDGLPADGDLHPGRRKRCQRGSAGAVRVADLSPRGSWAESSVKLRSMRDEEGNGGVARVRWEWSR